MDPSRLFIDIGLSKKGLFIISMIIVINTPQVPEYKSSNSYAVPKMLG